MTQRLSGTLCSCRHDPAHASVLYSAPDYISGDVFGILDCRRCGLVRTSPLPAGRTIASYYPRGYHAGRRYRGALEIVPGLLFASRARWLELANSRPGRVLEIGCGRGGLLHQLRVRGWKVIGTEINDEAARFARTEYGLDVRAADVSELGLAAGSLDAVILWHVLEHLEEPAAVLGKAVRLLRPGGWLLVSVPRFDSPLSRWAGAQWFQLDVPRHVSHFRLDVLMALLEEHTMKPVRTRHLTVEYDFFSFVQTTLNKLGLPTNLLFEALRRGEASMLGADHRSHAGALSRVLSVVAAIPLTVLSLIWQPIAAAMHRGDTITVLAQKQSPGNEGG